jgi:hypothetical protein
LFAPLNNQTLEEVQKRVSEKSKALTASIRAMFR